MPLSSLTVTISDSRIVDGWVEAANRNSMTPEEIAGEFLYQQGASYAGLFGVGIITSAAFMARFKPAEYAAIMAAMEESEEVAALVTELTSSPQVALDDPRLEPGLQALVEAELIDAERIPELLAYDRPEPSNAPVSEPEIEEDLEGEE
jgi:hypothetical protein